MLASSSLSFSCIHLWKTKIMMRFLFEVKSTLTDRINIVDQSSLPSLEVLRGCTLVNIHFGAINRGRQRANW